MNFSPVFRLLILPLLIGVLPLAARGQATFTLESTVGNPGDIVEVPVHIDSGARAPETCVLFINYDPDQVQPYEQYYEFIRTDLAGNPIRDAQGNTTTSTSAVRPEAMVRNANKQINTNTSQPGYLSVGILGGSQRLGDGHLLTIAFRIRSGVAATQEIVLDGDEHWTSATDSSAQAITVRWEDGEIVLGCTPPPAPTGINATTNRQDRVTVSWQASPVAGAQYRVFRSTQLNLASAVPLGDGWQTETSFQDFSALAPQASRDCFRPEPTLTTYFYWVQVRDEAACISEFSATPAQGGRAAAKSLLAASAAGGEFLVCYGLLALSLVMWRRTGRRNNPGVV